MRQRADAIFYHIGKVIWIPVLAAGLWFTKYGYSNYGDLFACSIYEKTGIPCPGCGGTRAFYHLFLGELRNSLTYHPAVLFTAVAYLHFMFLYFYRKHISKGTKDKEIHVEYYAYAVVVVILLQWMVKLLDFFNI